MAAAGGGSVRLTGGAEPVTAMILRSFACLKRQPHFPRSGGPVPMSSSSDARRVVHLELHTGNLPQACAFYARFLGCRFETVRLSGGSYLAMDLGAGIG